GGFLGATMARATLYPVAKGLTPDLLSRAPCGRHARNTPARKACRAGPSGIWYQMVLAIRRIAARRFGPGGRGRRIASPSPRWGEGARRPRALRNATTQSFLPDRIERDRAAIPAPGFFAPPAKAASTAAVAEPS